MFIRKLFSQKSVLPSKFYVYAIVIVKNPQITTSAGETTIERLLKTPSHFWLSTSQKKSASCN